MKTISMRIMWMMVPLLSVTAAVSAQSWKPVPGHISTPWAKDVVADDPLPQYPRPQMVRTQWQSLNGLWDCALAPGEASTPPTNFDTSILAPYPYESSLSGVGKESIPNQRLWYRRNFTIPNAWSGQRVTANRGEFIALTPGPTSQDQKQDPNSHVPQSPPAHEPQ